MKALSSLAFLAAVFALLGDFRFEVVVSTVFAAGLITIVVQDYGRRMKPLPCTIPVRRPRVSARFTPPPLNVEPNRLAA